MGTYLKPDADGRPRRPSRRSSASAPLRRRVLPLLIAAAVIVAIALAVTGR
jgi:hypothetical protein